MLYKTIDDYSVSYNLWIFKCLIVIKVKTKDDNKVYPFTNRVDPDIKIKIYKN